MMLWYFFLLAAIQSVDAKRPKYYVHGRRRWRRRYAYHISRFGGSDPHLCIVLLEVPSTYNTYSTLYYYMLVQTNGIMETMHRKGRRPPPVESCRVRVA
ncbi:hypothetical protein BDA96_06G220300 [Sorghum bicolor]|uniref:Secreted protein n=1 Tax=Sorghum bicolor TaxID=4558 RepID=A0A921QTB9_SORBI|nr:hypothetical protein BDA96_06G220300 [Sorghum bicolor]